MDNLQFLSHLFPLAPIVSTIGVGSWVLTIWMQAKHGYPLPRAWGQAIYPKSSDETAARIVTESSFRFDREIEGPRARAN